MIKRFKGFIEAGGEEESLLGHINKKRLPVHVAIIMDGNGRWAKARQMDRIKGHAEGAKSVRNIIECSLRLGIRFVTFFAFSSENWQRSPREVNGLMDMLYENLQSQRVLLVENQVKLNVIGELDRLPEKLRNKLLETEKVTADFKKMQVNLALNYGSRQEIVLAAKRIVHDRVPEDKINDKVFQKYLFTSGVPDPDLLIRTSGEHRISNFLLFQIAYSELYFTPVLWPDFRTREYLQAILEYQNRNRRYGSA